jgi:Putative stress-responsive transcriptional regulator
MSKQLTKSRTNKKVSGVIGGIGEYFGWSSDVITIVRIVYAVLALTSFGSLLLIYIVAAIVMPQPTRNEWKNKQDFSGFSQWPGDKPTQKIKRKM